MIELKINVEDEAVKMALVTFINNYKLNISDFVNQMVTNDGSPCDSDIHVNGNEITVFRIAPDKGVILGDTGNEDLPVQVMQYKDLGFDKRYVLPEKDKLILFFKTPEGEPDMRLGAFKTLSDMIKGFNSQPVKLELENIAEIRKAKKREDDRTKTRLERLNKQSVAEVEGGDVEKTVE